MEFVHINLCINSTTCVVPWLGQGFHKWVHSLCGSFHKSLLGFCGFTNPVNMGWLTVSGSTKIDGRSPLINWLASPTNSGAWDVAIVGKFICYPSHSTPGLPQGLPAIKSCLGGCPSMGIHLFLPITRLLWPPRHPFPSIIFGRMLVRGKCFPWLFPLLGTHPGHLRPLPLISPVCTHLFIANIFYL